MDFKQNQNRDVSWALVLTAIMCVAPVLYVLSSGPMKIVFEMLGKTTATHEQVYAPLVWLNDNTPASGAVDWYWDLFPTGTSKLNPNRGEYHDEYDLVGQEGGGNQERETDPLGDWLYSPEARVINRNLGVAE